MIVASIFARLGNSAASSGRKTPAFIIWRFYSRIRRMVVRQKLSKVRPWITVCVFPIALVLFAVLSISHGVELASLFGGAVVGIGLGLYGTRLTRFENTPEGMYYTP